MMIHQTMVAVVVVVVVIDDDDDDDDDGNVGRHCRGSTAVGVLFRD